MGWTAAWDGGDAEDMGCPQQQQHCFSTCPLPNAACTGPLHSGYCLFHTYAGASKEAAAFLAGLAVPLSSSGSGGHCCNLCFLTRSNEYSFFPGLGGFLVFCFICLFVLCFVYLVLVLVLLVGWFVFGFVFSFLFFFLILNTSY